MSDESASPIESLRWEGKTCIVVVAGEIGFERSNAFQKGLLEIAEKKPARIIVDLAKVEFMDSSGVASLVKLLASCKKKGITLRLAALDERVRSILEITRLDTVFDIRDTVEEAMK